MSQEPMKYGLLGEDDSSSEEKLSKYTGVVSWEYLRPHYETGALYYVDQELTLEEVGGAISADKKDRVEQWMKQADLVKIEALHAQQWEGTEVEFRALVVSPFVLCQLVRA